ncbi:MAG: hypothetical protein IPO61_00205 [Gammaproteobacteria bacterium]|nr:hypothetical protein [Gammaproteobacteria bacterium]
MQVQVRGPVLVEPQHRAIDGAVAGDSFEVPPELCFGTAEIDFQRIAVDRGRKTLVEKKRPSRSSM